MSGDAAHASAFLLKGSDVRQHERAHHIMWWLIVQQICPPASDELVCSVTQLVPTHASCVSRSVLPCPTLRHRIPCQLRTMAFSQSHEKTEPQSSTKKTRTLLQNRENALQKNFAQIHLVEKLLSGSLDLGAANWRWWHRDGHTCHVRDCNN